MLMAGRKSNRFGAIQDNGCFRVLCFVNDKIIMMCNGNSPKEGDLLLCSCPLCFHCFLFVCLFCFVLFQHASPTVWIDLFCTEKLNTRTRRMKNLVNHKKDAQKTTSR